MAKMIPEIDDTRSLGERKMYGILKEKLPESFRVYHNLPYTFIEAGGAEVGEIDFLVIHLGLGLLNIEVKGGQRIEYEDGSWYTTNRHGKRIRLEKDPFEQSFKEIRDLVQKIRERVYGGPKARLPFTYGHAVAFPEAEIGGAQLPMNADRNITIDVTELPEIKAAVTHIMEHWQEGRGESHFTLGDLQKLQDKVLMPTFGLAYSLGAQVSEGELAMQRMTREQFLMLDMLSEHHRALIQGCAGTGKTFLAMEKARRLASDGLDVLLLCYNTALADFLTEHCANYAGNITISTYHRLAAKLCSEATIPFVPGSHEEVFWNDEAPELLVQAAAQLGYACDAVIVDEGQDFMANWYNSLDCLLRDPEESYFYVFFDPCQRIYPERRVEDWPLREIPHRLIWNCRNTKRINEFVAEIAGIEPYSPDFCFEGSAVELISYEEPPEQVKAIEGIVSHLLKEGVEPGQIVILSHHKQSNSCLAGVERIGAKPLVEATSVSNPEAIRFSTLHSFKGLEAEAVILCDVDWSGHGNEPSHLYVAASRARQLLYVLHRGEWSPGAPLPPSS